MTRRCVVDINGNLLVGNNGYIYRTNSNPEAWVYDADENTAKFIAAAGGSRTVVFTATDELITFTVDDVECDIYNNQITPTPQAVPVKEFFARVNNTDSRIWKKAVKMVKFGNGTCAFQVVKVTNFEQSLSQQTDVIYAPVYIDSENIPVNNVVAGNAKLSLFNGNRAGYLDLISNNSDSGFFVNVMGLGLGSAFVVGEYDADGATFTTREIELPAGVVLPTIEFEETIFIGGNSALPIALNYINALFCNDNFAEIDIQDVVLESAAGNVTLDNGNLIQNESNIGTYLNNSAECCYNLTTENTSQITAVTYDPE